jgi:hypothetical protein
MFVPSLVEDDEMVEARGYRHGILGLGRQIEKTAAWKEKKRRVNWCALVLEIRMVSVPVDVGPSVVRPSTYDDVPRQQRGMSREMQPCYRRLSLAPERMRCYVKRKGLEYSGGQALEPRNSDWRGRQWKGACRIGCGARRSKKVRVSRRQDASHRRRTKDRRRSSRAEQSTARSCDDGR